MKILFLHTLASNTTLFTPLVMAALPHHDTAHDVQEMFLNEIREKGPTPDIIEQIHHYLTVKLAQAYDAIVCTCSTLGPIVDAYPNERVFRVDRPMAEQTLNYNNILVAVTLESTIVPTRTLLVSTNTQSHFDFLLIDDAWEHYRNGSMEAFCLSINNAVAKHLQNTPQNYNAVLFAQASMAYALNRCQFDIPVLSSPESCLNYLAKQLENG